MSPRHPGAAADRHAEHAETEARLRAALEARAALVTPHDLAPAPPPVGRAWGTRRVRRTVLAAVGAVAASVSLYLLLPGSPLRPHQAPPAYGPAASPTPPPSPSPSPSEDARPSVPTTPAPSRSPGFDPRSDPSLDPGTDPRADPGSGPVPDPNGSARYRRELDSRRNSHSGPGASTDTGTDPRSG
ncbi:hypothetical protein AB0I49_09685 [Streptomyces sp. NPDC050617]|uniref:hypothetical protein n=1 Tax=Streptomyces sp. NPDC050617 TaxID=3154628 RepID=UPI0034478A9E